MNTKEYKATIVILSGNAQTLSEQLRKQTGITSVNMVAADEGMLRRFREILQLVKKESTSSLLCFGCKDIDIQRYHAVLKGYLLFAKADKRLIIDEQGKYIRFNTVGFFLIDVPKLLAELVAGIFVVVITLIRLAWLHLVLTKHK